MQDQETVLTPPADKQTHNFDTEFSSHQPLLSTQRSKGLSHSEMKWRAIYANFPVIVTLSHSRSGNS